MTCPVCLEEKDADSMCALRCTHHLCSECLGQLRSPKCPICRVDIFEHQPTTSPDDEDDDSVNVNEYAAALLRELEMHTAPENEESPPWNAEDEITIFAYNTEEQKVYQVSAPDIQRHFLRGHRQRRLRRRRNQIQRVVNEAVKDIVSDIMALV